MKDIKKIKITSYKLQRLTKEKTKLIAKILKINENILNTEEAKDYLPLLNYYFKKLQLIKRMLTNDYEITKISSFSKDWMEFIKDDKF